MQRVRSLFPIALMLLCVMIPVFRAHAKQDIPSPSPISQGMAKSAPTPQNQEKPFASKNNYWDSLKEIERETGKKSSHSLYFRLKYKCKQGEEDQILRYCHFALANPVDDKGATTTALLHAISINRESLELLKKGAQLNNPVLLPFLGGDTPVPNWRSIYSLSLLKLFEAKYSASKKLKGENRDTESLMEEAFSGLEVLDLGGHHMCDNATLIHYLIGNGIRSNAADFLIELVEQDRSFTLDRNEIIYRIVNHEAKRNPLIKGWSDDLRLVRNLCVQTYGKMIPPNPPPDVVNFLRRKLAELRDVKPESLSKTEVLESFSTQTLSLYMNEYIRLGENFAALQPLEREAKTEEFGEQCARLTPRRHPLLQDIAIPELVTPLRMEQTVTTKLRLIVTTLAIQECVVNKRATVPLQSVKTLALEKSWAMDPYTEEGIAWEYIPPNRMILKPYAPSWFFEFDNVYGLKQKLHIAFHLPQEKVR